MFSHLIHTGCCPEVRSERCGARQPRTSEEERKGCRLKIFILHLEFLRKYVHAFPCVISLDYSALLPTQSNLVLHVPKFQFQHCPLSLRSFLMRADHLSLLFLNRSCPSDQYHPIRIIWPLTVLKMLNWSSLPEGKRFQGWDYASLLLPTVASLGTHFLEVIEIKLENIV